MASNPSIDIEIKDGKLTVVGPASSPATGGRLTPGQGTWATFQDTIDARRRWISAQVFASIDEITTDVHVVAEPKHRIRVITPAEVIEHYRTEIYDLEKAGRLIDAKAMRRDLDAYRAGLKKEGERT